MKQRARSVVALIGVSIVVGTMVAVFMNVNQDRVLYYLWQYAAPLFLILGMNIVLIPPYVGDDTFILEAMVVMSIVEGAIGAAFLIQQGNNASSIVTHSFSFDNSWLGYLYAALLVGLITIVIMIFSLICLIIVVSTVLSIVKSLWKWVGGTNDRK